jgi:hypothetical protein
VGDDGVTQINLGVEVEPPSTASFYGVEAVVARDGKMLDFHSYFLKKKMEKEKKNCIIA